MPLRHTSSTAQALYHTFVVPSLSQITRPSSRNAIFKSNRRLLSHTTTLSATTSRPPQVRREKWNEEITSKIIYLVDPETNTLIPEQRTRYDILRRIDLTTHRLVQFDKEYEGYPVCKVVNKKSEYERERRIKQAAKERKKLEGASKTLKTLELNWAMDTNDLSHRLDKVVEFLEEGRKVEVILASKKKGRKASVEECEDVLRRIRSAVESVRGAKEAKGMEGKVGGFATLLLQGRPVQQQQVNEA